MLTYIVKHKQPIKNAFLFFFIALFLFAVLGFYAIVSGQDSQFFFYLFSRPAGQAAVVVFVITILPGITRRFGIRNTVLSTIMLFRRQTGILTFLLALTHYFFIFFAPTIRSGEIPVNPPLYLTMGILSLYPMALLFLTSNDFAVKKMGKWWVRLHNLIYITAWTIFFHVALVEVSFWALLIGVFAVLEVLSLIWHFFRKQATDSKTSV